MIDLFKTFFEIVKDKENPTIIKIVIAILLFIALIAWNEYSGFTYYYSVSKEVEIINNIEQAKSYTNNQDIINYLNEREYDVINRKYLHQIFLDLFKKDELKKDVVASERNPVIETPSTYSKIITKVFPEMPYRSQFWHTVTSAFIPIIVLLFLLLAVLFTPFLKMEDGKIAVILVGVLFIFLTAGLIWLMQFLLGLIPVLFKRAYINYFIFLIPQVCFLIWFIRNNKKKAQNIN